MNLTYHDSYLGLESFDVVIDASSRLDELARNARELRGLPFDEKLLEVKRMASSAMQNAYEVLHDGNVTNLQAQRIVQEKHSLSTALKSELGCCRYQGALFFALGFEAELGDAHFLQTARVKPGVNSVYNEILQNDDFSRVSIFYESLKNKDLDYTAINPHLYNFPTSTMLGYNFLSYHKMPDGSLKVVAFEHMRVSEREMLRKIHTVISKNN